MLISWGIEPNAHICKPYFMGRYRSIYTNRCNYADIHANKDLCIGTVRYTCVRIKRNDKNMCIEIFVNMHTCNPGKKELISPPLIKYPSTCRLKPFYIYQKKTFTSCPIQNIHKQKPTILLAASKLSEHKNHHLQRVSSKVEGPLTHSRLSS